MNSLRADRQIVKWLAGMGLIPLGGRSPAQLEMDNIYFAAGPQDQASLVECRASRKRGIHSNLTWRRMEHHVAACYLTALNRLVELRSQEKPRCIHLYQTFDERLIWALAHIRGRMHPRKSKTAASP